MKGIDHSKSLIGIQSLEAFQHGHAASHVTSRTSAGAVWSSALKLIVLIQPWPGRSLSASTAAMKESCVSSPPLAVAPLMPSIRMLPSSQEIRMLLISPDFSGGLRSIVLPLYDS